MRHIFESLAATAVFLALPYCVTAQETSAQLASPSWKTIQVTQVPAHKYFTEVTEDAVNAAMKKLAPHPRLLLTDAKLDAVRRKIDADSRWKQYYNSLQKSGDTLYERPSIEYRMTGRRLLGVSRDALQRIFTWSFLYRYTKDVKYAERVEQELLAIATFPDWNPSHFLDTAEMTTAAAIGYDACFDTLSPESRNTIRTAILEKGITASLDPKNQGWFRNTANWNQVCHAGMMYGALAVAGDEPEFSADEIVRRSVNGITWSMSAYEPDGNYTEGPGYWGYGTSFNILLIAGLESTIGTDFGRGDAPGLLKSVDYYQHVFGTTGLAYNYPDSGGGRMFEPTVFWFVERLNDPSKAWNEAKMMCRQQFAQIAQIRSSDGPGFDSMVRHRLAPCALLWGDDGSARAGYNGQVIEMPPAPQELGFVGIGDRRTQVALLRTSWGRHGAAYLGIKCGSPSAPHGHMDIGGFVYDFDGLRWAIELGAEDYNKIEQLGMNLWSAAQDSDRWQIFRYNNFSHNTLTINGTKQLAAGRCDFTTTHVAAGGDTATEASTVSIDMTPVYKNDIARAVRTASLHPDGMLNITDDLVALPDQDAVVEWRMLTPAEAVITTTEGPETVARLQLPEPNEGVGKGEEPRTVERTLRAGCDQLLTMRVEPATGAKEFDAANPGVRIVIISFRIPAGESATLTVSLGDDKPLPY